MKNNKLIEEYINSLSDIEKKALEIAKKKFRNFI